MKLDKRNPHTQVNGNVNSATGADSSAADLLLIAFKIASFARLPNSQMHMKYKYICEIEASRFYVVANYNHQPDGSALNSLLNMYRTELRFLKLLLLAAAAASRFEGTANRFANRDDHKQHTLDTSCVLVAIQLGFMYILRVL